MAGAWDAPPLNRLEVTIKVLRHYIFAMLFAVLKYMACQVPLDKPLKRQAVYTHVKRYLTRERGGEPPPPDYKYKRSKTTFLRALPIKLAVQVFRISEVSRTNEAE